MIDIKQVNSKSYLSYSMNASVFIKIQWQEHESVTEILIRGDADLNARGLLKLTLFIFPG